MNEDLLQAAARVLARHGAARFNTNQVAEAAGVSVGSLYQYYPNKAALLLALHERDAEQAWAALAAILDDDARPARARLHQVIQQFFAMQSGAVEHHLALQQASALVSGTPEFRAFEARVVERLQAFLARALPRRTDCRFFAQLWFTVVTATGERLGTRHLPAAELHRIADATATMLADHIGL